MIFVTVGSQKFQFNRLIHKVDDLVASGSIQEEVFIQCGESDYLPKYCDYAKYLNHERFAQISYQSDLFITHGGTGAIIGAVKKRKKVIAVPRLAKFGEHVDNHQLQILHQFERMNLILPCYNLDNLDNCISAIRHLKFNRYESNTQVIIDSITDYIDKY